MLLPSSVEIVSSKSSSGEIVQKFLNHHKISYTLMFLPRTIVMIDLVTCQGTPKSLHPCPYTDENVVGMAQERNARQRFTLSVLMIKFSIFIFLYTLVHNRSFLDISPNLNILPT